MADGSAVARPDAPDRPARGLRRSVMRRGVFVIAVGPGDLAGALRLLRRAAVAASPRLHSCIAFTFGLDAAARAALTSGYPRITLVERPPARADDVKKMLFADADLVGFVTPAAGGNPSERWDAARLRICTAGVAPERLARRLRVLRTQITRVARPAEAAALEAERSAFLDDVLSRKAALAGEARVFYGLETLAARPYHRVDALKLAVLALRERMPRAAVAAFERDPLSRGRTLAQAAYQAGRACRQSGDDERARRLLNLAARRDPRFTLGVACELAEISILKGALGAARAALARAAAERPDDARVEALRQRIDLRRDLALERLRTARQDDRITHVAAYQTDGGDVGNAGDVLVPIAPRKALERAARRRLHWGPFHVHDAFGAEQIAYANDTRGVLVGGGGLFIADSGHNGVSGWQWNVSIEALARLKVPLALSGVGYNRFYDQRAFDPIFADALAALVDKAVFVGLRNRGSIRALAAMLPQPLANKLELHPCATTVLSRLMPRMAVVNEPPFVALNCALDRGGLRFGAGYDAFISEMARAVRKIRRTAPVVYYAHGVGDVKIRDDVASAVGFDIPCVDLYAMNSRQIVAAYARPALVIGMRGHAIMIPFGLGVPAISLISHPKLRFFLEDTGLLHTGLDADEPELGEKLAALALRMIDRRDDAVAEIAAAQDDIWRRLVWNNRRIARAFGLLPSAQLTTERASPAVPPPARS